MGLVADDRTGLYTWTKGPWNTGADFSLSQNFGTREFTCPCTYRTCITQFAHRDLISALEKLRATVGPIKVNSGYRCQAHQLDLLQKGYQATTGTSQHTLGHAADIESPGNYPSLVQHAPAFFRAIGTAANWIHVDTRADKERRWTY